MLSGQDQYLIVQNKKFILIQYLKNQKKHDILFFFVEFKSQFHDLLSVGARFFKHNLISHYNCLPMDTKINEKEQLFEKDNLTGENQGALLPNQKGRYLTASSLEGDKVVSPTGEHLGEIKEIMLDMEAGKIDYFVIE